MAHVGVHGTQGVLTTLLRRSRHAASTLRPITSWLQHGCSGSCITPALQARSKNKEEGKRCVLKGQPCLKNLLEVPSSCVCLRRIGQNCVTGHPRYKGGWNRYTLGQAEIPPLHHQSSVSKQRKAT